MVRVCTKCGREISDDSYWTFYNILARESHEYCIYCVDWVVKKEPITAEEINAIKGRLNRIEKFIDNYVEAKQMLVDQLKGLQRGQK